VAILVVDDFRLKTEREPNKVFEQGNCLVTPDGQGRYGSEGAATRATGFPHGKVVYDELITQIESHFGPPIASTRSGALLSNQPDWIVMADRYQASGQDLLVVGVDTLDFTTDFMTQVIPQAIDLFSNPNNQVTLDNAFLPPFERFVVNMSFAILPCDPLGAFGKDAAGLLQEYQGLVDNIPELNALKQALEAQGATSEQVARALWQAQPFVDLAYSLAPGFNELPGWIYSDPFYELVKSQNNSDLPVQVYYVGAAGNHKLPFPFAPAIWDFVASISATTGDDYQSLADYSNYGEVRMDGRVTNLPQVEGTSFAAPKFAYYAARYLLQGGRFPCTDCPDGLCANISPPLGYTQEREPWKNMTLDEAMGNFCTSFLAP
jgi:hypothetical protein